MTLVLIATIFLTACGGGGETFFTPNVQTTRNLLDAVNKNNVSEVRRWLAVGANLNATDNDGDTSLHLAALEGFVEIVQLLIDAKANLEAREDNGFTPLHNGAYNGHVNVIRTLLDAGANRSAESNNGNTPQELAAQRGHINAAQFISTYTPNQNGSLSPNSAPTSQRGPGYTDTVGGAIAAVRAIAQRSRGNNSIPLVMECYGTRVGCLPETAHFESVLGHATRINHGHDSDRPEGAIRVPGYRGLVGDWNAQNGSRGGWGEWMYFYVSGSSQSYHDNLRNSGWTDLGATHTVRLTTDTHAEGIRTSAGTAPDFSTARYKGATVARYVRIGDRGDDFSWQTGVTWGDADVTVDMTSEVFQVRLSNFNNIGNVPELASGLSFAASMSTNSGNVNRALTQFGERTAGQVDFYGPKHEEVGGTYIYSNVRPERFLFDERLIGTVTDSARRGVGLTVIGAFGAQREAQ